LDRIACSGSPIRPVAECRGGNIEEPLDVVAVRRRLRDASIAYENAWPRDQLSYLVLRFERHPDIAPDRIRQLCGTAQTGYMECADFSGGGVFPMVMVARIAVPVLWILWLGYWMVAAGNVKATRWQPPTGQRLLQTLPFVIAPVFFIAQTPNWGVLGRLFIPFHPIEPVLGALILAAGFAFAVWARLHLGRDWSGTVRLKEDHSLVTSGPYRFVRHPIYTGILLGFIGTALSIGEWRGILAILIILFGILVRCRAEEQAMREVFPDYDDYRRKTWALIPFLY
jgi:protein-S-isoprenylcysteine O-methyltransferase Ste14